MNNIYKENESLIEGLLKDYNLVFKVNLENASYSLLKIDPGIIGEGMEFSDFYEARKFFIDEVTYGSDRPLLRQEMDFDTIRRRIKEEKTYSVEYRAVIEGVAIWHEMVINHLGENEVAIGYAIKDEEILSRHISKTLIDNSDAIYVVNLDTDQMKVLKASGIMKGKPKIVSYSALLKEYAKALSVDAKKYFLDASDIEYEKSKLKKERRLEFVYCSPYYHEERSVWLKSETNVLTYVDGEPETIVITISRVDSIQREKIELNEKLNEALSNVTEEKNRFTVAADLIHSANWSFTLDEKDEIIDSKFFGNPTETLGISADITPQNWERILHPEDKERTFDAFNAAIRDHSGKTPYDCIYRMSDINGKYNWFRAAGKFIELENGKREFFGILININDRIEKDNQHRREIKESRLLIKSVASVYRFAFTLDMITREFKTIRIDDEVKRRPGVADIKSFDDAIKPLFTMLHPSDRERMAKELDFDTIRRKLKSVVSYNVEYRVITNGATNWHEMNVTLISGDEIAMGFAEKDIEITKRHLEENRYAEYFALYEVDVDQETVKIVIDSPYYGIDRAGTAIPYSTAMMAFASSLDGGAKDYFKNLANLERVKRELAEEGKHTYTYKSNNVDKKWVDCTSFVTYRHEDGTPAMFTLGFSYIDSYGAARQDLQSQIAKQKTQLEKQQKQLQDALETANTEAQKNDLIINAIQASKWSYEISADDEVVGAHYSDDMEAAADRKYSGRPMGWLDLIHPEDKGRVLQEFMATIFDHSGKTLYDSTYRVKVGNNAFRWFRSAGRVIRHQDGNGEFTGMSMDLTEQIAQREKLERRTAISDYFLKSYVTAYYVDLVRNDALILHSAKDSKIASLAGKRFPIDELIAMYIDSVHPDDREMFVNYLKPEFIRKQVKSTKEFNFTYRQNFGTDSNAYRCTIIPGNDDRHAAIGFKNITEELRIQKEQQLALDLANQQRHIKAFGDMVNAALWSVDINENSEVTGVSWSDEFRRMLGFEQTIEDFPNTKEAWSSRLHPDDKERTLKHFYDGIKRQEKDKFVYDIQYRILRKGGDYCWYHAVGRIEDNEDATKRMYGILLDISADKKLEEQLALADGLSRDYHTVWLLDGFGKHNMHLYRSTGIKTIKSAVQLGLDEHCYDTGVVKYIRDFVHEDDQERVLEQTKFETVERETPENGTYVVSYRRYNMEHTAYDYHQMCYAKAVADNGTVNYIFAYRDADKMLREQIAQQEMLEKALAEAQAANKAKTEFLFNMSHDVRTPMNAITGFANMAIKNIDNKEKVLDCLEKLQKSGNLLLTLINGVLDMSRIESGNVVNEEQPGDVFLSFTSIESTLKEEAAKKDIALNFEFGDVTDRYVYADFSRCVRVFTNLIANAIKYTNAGGYVKMRCEQASQAKDGKAFYKYTVEDNGIGMSREFQKHMFEPFARERNSTTSGIQGTGLGLSVCKAFVEFLNGSINCKSKLGKGTTFTVILPFRIQEGKEYTDPLSGNIVSSGKIAAPSKPMDFTGRKILLVEDNELNREIAVEILTEEGLIVDEAQDGSKAIELLKQKGPNAYDFILMDIQMPVMNGYEATKAIRAMYPDAKIPIIALSANAFAEDKAATLAAGMNDHVAKPIKTNELFAAMAKFL